jgi:8-amino-7-oxononanoate synthase
MAMIDFTSALYLGMHHPSQSLQPWRQLTLGVPAALAEPPGAGEVALALAELQGCEQAVLMPSTLHLFWDLFGMLSKQPVTIYLDEGAYAIARWGRSGQRQVVLRPTGFVITTRKRFCRKLQPRRAGTNFRWLSPTATAPPAAGRRP